MKRQTFEADGTPVAIDQTRRSLIRAVAISPLAGALVSGLGKANEQPTASPALFKVPGPAPESAPAAKKLRVAVVGGGFGLSWPWHLHPNCEVTAVAELRSDRRDKLKQQFKCDNAYSDFHELLNDKRVDAVAIYTEATNHAKHCLDVLKAGKNVVTVIPVATSLEECQQLIDVVKSTGKTYLYGETSCFTPAALAARQLHLNGEFGQIFHTDSGYVHDIYTDMDFGMREWFVRDGKPTWRYGYPQGFYTGHASGPVIHVTRDKFVEVCAVGTRLDHPIWHKNQYGNPFVNTTFFFKTASGNSSQASMFWLTSEPETEGADYFGTKLTLHEAHDSQTAKVTLAGGKHALEPDLSAYVKRLPAALQALEAHGGAHGQIIHEFVLACLNERKPSVDVAQGVAITAPGLVGFQSALKGGELLKVPDFGAI